MLDIGTSTSKIVKDRYMQDEKCKQDVLREDKDGEQDFVIE